MNSALTFQERLLQTKVSVILGLLCIGRDRLPPENKEDYKDTQEIISIFQSFIAEIERGNTTPERLSQIDSYTQQIFREIFPEEAQSRSEEIILQEEKLLQELKTQTPPETIDKAWRELQSISKKPHPENIRISKDLIDTQTHSVGDTLEYIQDPKVKADILKKQAEGKLLAGTLEGLSGGSAYLKSFTIALAHTLNEQSKYYKTEEDYSGVPRDLIPDIFGEDVEIQKEASLPVKIQRGERIEIRQEKRKFPYILVSYEDLASKMRGKGKKRGGKDSEYIREYIESLSGKVYLLDKGKDSRGKQILVGVPFLVRELYIYREGREVGCLLRLNPQFSKTIRGYTSLRADTIQLIGGGRQKDITMSLLDLLLYVRGTDRGYIWRKNKDSLLSQIATSKRYLRQKGEREVDFREAVQKCKDSGLITDYQEEKSTTGETISVFRFNPYYSKRETADVQIPEEE